MDKNREERKFGRERGTENPYFL
jgi:hypothetical protein